MSDYFMYLLRVCFRVWVLVRCAMRIRVRGRVRVRVSGVMKINFGGLLKAR